MSSAVGSQLGGMAFVMGAMFLSRRIDFKVPENLFILRIAYAISQAVVLITYYYMWTKIKQKKDTTLVTPAKAMGATEEPKQISAQEYDSQELRKMFTNLLVSWAIIGFIHFKLGSESALFLQVLLPIKNMLSTQLFQIHVMGSSAEGALARPFKAPNPFGGLMDESKTETKPTATIEELPDEPATSSEVKKDQ